jgi:6-phospho-beta-glucosidase
MRLAIVGGGGFRVPLIHRALVRDTGSPRVEHVVLFDPDRERAELVRGVLDQHTARQPAAVREAAPRVEVADDLDDALGGADFVFSAIRVGGAAGRICDERVALDLGVLGQETTGPGGLAYALRTVPVALRLAERVKACAPNAYVINFTNPAGIVTEAMRTVLGSRVIGICDTPISMGRRLSTVLGVPSARVHLDYVGLNHLGWLRGLVHDGVDRLPELLADDRALAGTEEAAIFGVPWLKALGSIPNEYLYYHYFNRDAVRSIVDGGTTRGEYLLGQQDAFYRAAAADPTQALRLWERATDERSRTYMAEARGAEAGTPAEQDGESGGYEGVALAAMGAIARDERAMMILNVANGTTLPGLDADAVVEVPCAVDANGAHPLATAPPDNHQSGLMQQVKAVERLTIEAAVTGSRTAALKAFALHPLVDSVTVARDLLAGYLARSPEIAAVLTERGDRRRHRRPPARDEGATRSAG